MKNSKSVQTLDDDVAVDDASFVNPWRLWHGAFLPNWLLIRPEISFAAKCAYARLAQYAGKNGRCFPKQETLAAELGISKRQARRYVEELVDWHLLVSVKTGNKTANEYRFLKHEWMGPEFDGSNLTGQKMSDRSNLSPADGSDLTSLTGQIWPVIRDSNKRIKGRDSTAQLSLRERRLAGGGSAVEDPKTKALQAQLEQLTAAQRERIKQFVVKDHPEYRDSIDFMFPHRQPELFGPYLERIA